MTQALPVWDEGGPRWGSFIVAPSTLLRWHRELVKRKWTYKAKKLGHPPVDPKIVAMICRMARENPTWGYMRIQGDPALRRDGPTWSEFLRSQAEGIVACDFFAVESVFLRTNYVLFFIEVGSRRIHIEGVTANPDALWVTQQARNLSMQDGMENVRFLIRDRDSKFTASFDEVFRTEGARVIKTPLRSPNANASAERFVRSARTEVFDLTLVTGRRHLLRLLQAYEAHYNSRRPHRGIDLAAPETIDVAPIRVPTDRIRRRGVIGGLINEYHGVAA